MADSIDPGTYSTDEDVRQDIAFSTSSLATLRLLAHDTHYLVRNAVSLNDLTPPDAINYIAELPLNDDDELTSDRPSVANTAIHPNTSIENLIRLAGMNDPDVNLNLAWNENTPVEILAKLSRNDDAEISDAAAATLKAIASADPMA